MPAALPPVARPDVLLDQLDPPPLTLDRQPIVEVLRPAYQLLRGGD
jgi:hypothetical protein